MRYAELAYAAIDVTLFVILLFTGGPLCAL
jgi:hypothetical protein